MYLGMFGFPLPTVTPLLLERTEINILRVKQLIEEKVSVFQS